MKALFEAGALRFPDDPQASIVSAWVDVVFAGRDTQRRGILGLIDVAPGERLSKETHQRVRASVANALHSLDQHFPLLIAMFFALGVLGLWYGVEQFI